MLTFIFFCANYLSSCKRCVINVFLANIVLDKMGHHGPWRQAANKQMEMLGRITKS